MNELSIYDLTHRQQRHDIFNRQVVEEWIFLLLQVLGGHLGMGVLLITFFVASRDKLLRPPVIINFCVTWMISSICYSLLLYAYRADPRDLSLTHESDRFCLSQAVLIYACQSMTSLSTLSLIIHLWLRIRFCIKYAMVVSSSKNTCTSASDNPHVYINKSIHPESLRTQVLLCTLPYLGFLGTFIPIWIISSRPIIPFGGSDIAPDWALPTQFYCTVVESSQPLNLTSSTSGQPMGTTLTSSRYRITVVVGFLCVGASLLGFLVEGHTLWCISHFKKRAKDIPYPAEFAGTFSRVFLFSLFRFVPLVFFIIGLYRPDQFFVEGINTGTNAVLATISDFLQASLPLTAFLVLASKQDVLSHWHITRRRSVKPESNVTLAQLEAQLARDEDMAYAR